MPKISGIDFLDDVMVVTLHDDRVLQVPLKQFPKLAGASEAQRKNYSILPGGAHWLELDEDLSTKGLIRASEEADLPPMPTVQP